MQTALPALGIVLGACISSPATSETAAASTVVGDYVSGSCSTAVVLGLSKQIADEIACEHASSLVSFSAADSSNITFASSAVLPYMEADAKADLLAVANDHALTVNSTFRTIAQQYLLYRWYQQGSCGITAAAHPGTSNHESGRAVDLSNWSSVVGAMSANGWDHDVPGDPVHFDHNASDDIRGQDVHAFQVLWNMNNPNDTIAEDGSYGPQTQARLAASPATGFATGPSCTMQRAHVANVVSVDGPDQVAQLSRATYAVTLANAGTTDWPAGTVVVLDGGATASPLYDASWETATQITTLADAIPAGGQVAFSLAVSTPAVTSDTPFTLPLALSDGSTAIDSFSVALTVVPNPLQQPTSGDGNDETGYTSGGCAAGGGGDGWLVAFAMLALMAGRTRRCSR